MRIIYLNGEAMTDRVSAHEHMQDQLGVTGYQGHNLDALYDALSAWNEELLIILTNKNELLSAMDDYGKKIMSVLNKVADENKHITFEIN